MATTNIAYFEFKSGGSDKFYKMKAGKAHGFNRGMKGHCRRSA